MCIRDRPSTAAWARPPASRPASVDALSPSRAARPLTTSTRERLPSFAGFTRPSALARHRCTTTSSRSSRASTARTRATSATRAASRPTSSRIRRGSTCSSR
eukprot:3212432-Prymnesium_polylepis.1